MSPISSGRFGSKRFRALRPILVFCLPAIGDFIRCHAAIRIIAENTPGVQSVRDNISWVEPMTGIVLSSPETRDKTD